MVLVHNGCKKNQTNNNGHYDFNLLNDQESYIAIPRATPCTWVLGSWRLFGQLGPVFLGLHIMVETAACSGSGLSWSFSPLP